MHAVQEMNDLFERPCVIVELEKGASNGFLEAKGPVGHRTNLVNMTIGQLVQSKVRVMFSSSQKETGDILAALLSKEVKKGYGLPRSLAIGLVSEEHYMPFYTSLPGVSCYLRLRSCKNT